MIVRILTEGQYNLPGAYIDELNEVDNRLVEVVEMEDEAQFGQHLKTMLDLVRDNGTLRFFTHAARPEPRAGDVIVSFAPPQERSAQDAAAKRDRKRNKTAEQGA